MNFLPIIAIFVTIFVGYYAISGGELFGSDRGPIATGPDTSEVRNPQPVSHTPFGPFFSPPPPPLPSPETPLPPAPPAGQSSYRDKVKISTVQRSGERPDEEYVGIRYQSGFWGQDQGFPVDVTGWRIGGLKGSSVIPKAFAIPEIDAAEQDVALPPGGELIVVSGTPSYQRNFRENLCVGYFSQSNAFTPSLSNFCPNSNINRANLLDRGLSGVCIDFIDRVSTCRTPAIGFEQSGLGQACVDYIRENMNYIGCVKNFRDRPDFLQPRWRVSLKRPTKLFDPLHDRVSLRDQNGLLVDEFEY